MPSAFAIEYEDRLFVLGQISRIPNFFKKGIDNISETCYNIKAVNAQAHTLYAEVAEWQTRYFEGVVGVFSCGFKSHSPHHVALNP